MEELFEGIALKQWIQQNLVVQEAPPQGAPPQPMPGPQGPPPQPGASSPFDGVEEGVPPVMVAGSEPPEGIVPRGFVGEEE